MPLSIDHSQPLRTQDELRGLVAAIRDAPATEPETDSLEWKSEWDLNETEKCFETAKHILGFGNRSVSAARGDFGGCGYLALGVEPGNLCGASPLDPATLNGKLGRYIESGKPRWSPQYIDVDGLSVLIVTIEAPRDGDSICTLQKAFGGFGEGRVFIRRHGQTEEAKPAEIRDLERRIRSGRPQVELDVRRVGESNLPIVSIPPALEKAWTKAERKRLALPPDPATQVQDPFRFPQPPVTMHMSIDTRSRDSYQQEVSAYMQQAGRHLRAEVIEQLIEAGVAGMKLEIGNPTGKNFDGVEVLLKIPSGPTIWHQTHEVMKTLGARRPPKPWGEQRPYEVLSPDIQSLAFRSSVEIARDEGGTTVRFEPEHVRPFASVSLPTVHLVLQEDPGEVEISWTLTSSGVDGQAAGTVVCQVDEKPLIPNLRQPD